MAEEEVALRTSLKDRRQTVAGLKDVDDGLERVGRQAETSGRRARIAGRGFDTLKRSGRLAGFAMKAAFGAALAIGYGVVRLTQSAFAEAREAQKVGALTRAVIKSTGGVANVSARQVEKLATKLSLVAGIDDELIQTGANLLLTFKNIRNETGKGNKIFDRATTAAVDLSAAGFGSVESASKMLGKALNDPLKGVTALGRAGVTFSQGQKDQITKMVEQNDLLGAQKIILGEVTTQVGGAAKAQATWGDKAKVFKDNILESLGTAMLPLLDRVSKWFVNKGGPQLQHYVDIFEDKGVPALSKFLRKARPLANEVLPAMGTVLGTVRDVIADAVPYAQDLVGAFNDMPDWAKKGGVIAALAGIGAAKTGVLGSRGGGGLLGMVSKAKPLPVFVVNEGFGPGIPGSKPGSGPISGVVKATTALVAPAAVAALATAALHTFNTKVIPDATQPAIAPGSGGTGSLPGGSFDFGDDATKVQFPNLIKLIGQVRSGIDSARIKTKLFGGDLAKTGGTRVAPRFETPGFPEAHSTMKNYKTLLTDVGKPVTTTIDANTSPARSAVAALGAQISSTLNQLSGGLLGRASGGPVAAGTPYVVGERRPELFVPKVDGYILPRVPNRFQAPDMPTSDFGDGTLRMGGGGASTIQLVLPDGRVLFEWVMDQAETAQARS